MTQGMSPHKHRDSVIQETPPDEQGLDAEGSLDAIIPQHPIGIKPAGNQFVAGPNIKAAAGVFSYVPDELLIQLFEFVGPMSLLQVGATCKALYAFTRFEDLWRTQFLKYAFLFKLLSSCSCLYSKVNLPLAVQ